jgi:hypothetical protein
MSVMLSGAFVALSELADDIYAKKQFKLLSKPAASEDKTLLPYAALTKDNDVQHHTFIILRAIFLVAGLRDVEDTNGKLKCDALGWLLDVSMMSTRAPPH